jgi:rhomboid protease GluP
MGIVTKRSGGFTAPELITWGSNFGPLTVNGQWWRLITASFVHLNLSHLLLNMWALANIGRMCERIFGRASLTFLYFACALLASLSSIAWNPDLSSVGASGAIFGIFGAFLAFFLNPRNRVPPTIARRHWISTSVFAAYNLINGALQPGIDNAAHVGGLIAGFALGWILTRPLEGEGRQSLNVKGGVFAGLLLALSTLAAIWQVKGIGSELTVPEQYYQSHVAFFTGQVDNLRVWAELAGKAQAGSMSDAELGDRFERDIVPFWRAAHTQLDNENKTLKGPLRAYALLIADYAKARDEWAQAAVEIVRSQDASRAAEIAGFLRETNLAAARVERMDIRARMDHRPRALANNPLVATLRRLLTGYRWSCIEPPAVFGPTPTSADNKQDGPFARNAIGCTAQQLFMSGDYRALDSLMERYAARLADLPDGSSHYEGIIAGLDTLFFDGGIDPLQLLGRTADWRRSVKQSARPDVIEATVFAASAWSVRGHGYAKEVSAQQWALFAYRTEMAAAALAATADSARTDPAWYQFSLDVGLDGDVDVEHLRTVFDQGHEKFPAYRPLERRMLRILMPRWRGSFEKVDQFINGIYQQTAPTRGFERYAELYSTYTGLEGDEFDLFGDTPAFWSGIRKGYIGLSKRYPTSDIILNRFANMACRAGDADQYRELSADVVKRYSTVAWSGRYSRADCDKKFANVPLTSVREANARQQEASGGRIQSFGGIRLGISPTELGQLKGHPLPEPYEHWTYNIGDSSHHAMLMAVFSPTTDTSDPTIVSIEFTGDEVSAPSEVPYLNGLTEDDLKERFGYLVGMGSPEKDVVTLRFKNGVYADTRDGKVFRYGIYAARRPR